MRKGVLLINLGTPDAPKVRDVRRYLRQFLMDGRVIDIPWLPRFMLVNGIIAPFRAPKSTKVYKEVWLKEGSPLKVYGERLASQVQQLLGTDYVVGLAMRYQNPSIEKQLQWLKREKVSEIVILPLFPQYASATTGSVIEEVNRIMSSWQTIPPFRILPPFFDQAFFLQPIAKRLKEAFQDQKPDKILFTYHGLPERQIKKGDDYGYCRLGDCCHSLGDSNRFCYRAQCFATTRLLAKYAEIPEDLTATSFQSRLGSDPWIKPYTEDLIKEWPKQGVRKVLALSPSFVADCLETTEEIGMEYKEVFLHAGGSDWHLLPCLNDDMEWSESLSNWIKSS